MNTLYQAAKAITSHLRRAEVADGRAVYEVETGAMHALVEAVAKDERTDERVPDVLSVFDAYAEVEGTGVSQAEHDATRAKLAELIAAAEVVDRILRHPTQSVTIIEADRLRAALAACGVKS